MPRSSSEPIVDSEAPDNAETKLEKLRESVVTHQPDVYVRDHGDVPEIDAATQPARPRATWSNNGYLSTAWHQLQVTAPSPNA